MKLAVVLFNLGGPDSLEAVEPFLRNLFSDPAIIGLPALLRLPIARLAARRRAPLARKIYAEMGGASPINAETERQARALETVLASRGLDAKCFVAMRCWHPLIADTARAVKVWAPERIVLLPLYPQYSTTTTASSFQEWDRAARLTELAVDTQRVCCYPAETGFIEALSSLIHSTLTKRRGAVDYRVLFSAHGLPKRVVARGDPYCAHVEQTAQALVDPLGIEELDWRVTFQSRVGPLEWIGPATDAEIRAAGAEGKGVVVVPITFVSEHSETLVELDIDYARLAHQSGVPHYLRVPTVSAHERFIEGLADLAIQALKEERAGTPCARLCFHARGRT